MNPAHPSEPHDASKPSRVPPGSSGEVQPSPASGEVTGGLSHRRSGLSSYYGMRPGSQRADDYGGYAYGAGGYPQGYYPGGQGNGPQGGGALSSFSISRMLRSKWLMLACFVLISGAVIPWIWVLHHPEYESTAVVRVSPIVSYLVFKTENNGFLPMYSQYLNTQIAIIRSPKILERVLDHEQVKESRWYKEGGRDLLGNRASALGRLVQATSVRARPGTELVDVKVSTEYPEDTKLLADAIVDEHRQYVEETLRENEAWLIETLQKEHTELLREIQGLNAMRYTLAKKVGVLDVAGLQGQLRSYVGLLEAELHRLQRSLDLSRWEMEKMAASQPAAESAEADPATTRPAIPFTPDYDQDPERRELKATLEAVNNEIEISLHQIGPQHPRMKQLEVRKAIAERMLNERDAEIDRVYSQLGSLNGATPARLQQMHTLEEDAKKTEYEVALVDEELNKRRAELADISDMALELARYEEEIANKTTMAETVRKRLEVMEFEGRHAPARVKVASYALKPSSPSTDRRMQMSLMTLAVSLLVSLALGYVRTTLDKRIYEVRELQQVYRSPFLGMVPTLPTTKVPRELGGTLPLATTGSTYYYSYAGADSCQALMESIRMARTAMLERMSEDNQRAVLVTSSVPRTGKSSVAVLLARSLALLNKRVLLIEADLRHPTLAGRLNISAKAGLASILTGSVPDDQAVLKTDIPNLDVMVAGEIPEGFSTEMLANGVFASCLERWKQEYDFCLLDSPPILPVADARILARYVDGTIMVLRSSHDLRHEAMEAYAQLSAAGGKLLGSIFIGGSSKRAHPYSHGYGYTRAPLSWQWRHRYGYYGYGSGTGKPKPPVTAETPPEDQPPSLNGPESTG